MGILLFLFLNIVYIIWLTTVFVPQDSVYIVEFMAGYARTLKPGRHILIPVHEKVTYKIFPTDGELDLNFKVGMECLTKETVPVLGNAKISFHILDVRKAVFDTENHIDSVVSLVKTIIQREVGKIELDKVKESFSEINTVVTKEVSRAAGAWGIMFLSCEIIKIS